MFISVNYLVLTNWYIFCHVSVWLIKGIKLLQLIKQLAVLENCKMYLYIKSKITFYINIIHLEITFLKLYMTILLVIGTNVF